VVTLRYENLKIKNFRGFKELTISNLTRINLFVGKNAVGKTALLEAVFVHSGFYNPSLEISVNALRGLEPYKSDPLTSFEVPWSSLFNDYKMEDPIEIESDNEKGKSKTRLKALNLEEKIQLVEKLRRETFGMPVFSAESIQVLQFQFQRDIKQENREYFLILDQNDLRVLPVPQSPDFSTIIIPSSRRPVPQELSEKFSKLMISDKKLIKDIVDVSRIFEPRLREITILTVGNIPILHADIGIGRFVPIYYLSEGLVRALYIGLSMFEVRNGVLLIDEIENGIHYSVLRDFWKFLSKLSELFNVQIFATTHSYECIAAAHEAFSKDSSDFKLYRLEKLDEEIVTKEFSNNDLETVFKAGFEIR